MLWETWRGALPRKQVFGGIASWDDLRVADRKPTSPQAIPSDCLRKKYPPHVRNTDALSASFLAASCFHFESYLNSPSCRTLS